jgi:uncharacterized protein YjiS (DUF1127 family)
MTIVTVADLHEQPREGMLERLSATLALWRKRSRERAELAMLQARDARDLGITVASIQFEANKPFWMA